MKIVCINGAPMAGKDLFCQYCMDEINGYAQTFSTVDKVKEIARSLGWNGQKTPENRKFLSDLKDALTEWKDMPYCSVIESIEDWLYVLNQYDMNDEDIVAFVHVREPKEIEKFVKRDFAITLLLRRTAAEILPMSNHADRDTQNYNYDFEIWNDGTKEELKNEARTFLKTIGVKVKDRR